MPKKNNMTELEKKQIAMLLANNKMLEETKKQMEEHEKLTNKPIPNDIKELVNNLSQSINNNFPENIIQNAKEFSYEDMFPPYQEKKQYEIKDKNIMTSNYSTDANNNINYYNSNEDNDDIDYYDFREDNDDDVAYDVLTLPSLGQCYKNKKSKIKVAYLTTSDEDLITSPNLYKDGKIIDVLLSRKILDKNIKPEDLVKGDRDAITLWLRITGYGKDLPIRVTDPESETGEAFDSVADLTDIKIKDFNLIGDENGYFEFITPIKNDKIKFKFLTYKELKKYEKIIKNENTKINKIRLGDTISNLERLSKNEILNESDIKNLNKMIQDLKVIYNKMQITDNAAYTKIITTGLIMQIVEVNGNTDRQYIKKYVNNMNTRDSYELRKYINDNEPGVDFTITVKRPENLGGGSFKTFLEFDEYVFINIA
jgi:hypothetical protein